MDIEGNPEMEQADLTHLRLQEMTPTQRAELRRRYDQFVRHFVGSGRTPHREPERKPRVSKWVPGAKAQPA
jgi:hypothetical protein